MRLFLGNDVDRFQVLDISQNANDSSIYFSAPVFDEIQWRVLGMQSDGSLALVTYQVADEGKLSIHRSGIVHAKAHGVRGSNQFAIAGQNTLKSADGTTLGVRHLVTIFPSEPRHKPSSHAGKRRTDGWITANPLDPMVLIFWAVPLHGLTVEVNSSFHVDDLEEVPPKSGWGAFELETHALVFFAYRTKHMMRWPKNSQAFYTDGYTVPVLIGTGTGECRVVYAQPTYQLDGKRLQIALGHLGRNDGGNHGYGQSVSAMR